MASPAYADCPAPPIGNANDMVVSFMATHGTQNAPASIMPSTVKEGMLVYDSTADSLKLCDGTTWHPISMGTANDPRIGTLDAGKWCSTDGTIINCTTDAPATVVGNDKEVIFNDGGTALAGAAQLFWDKATNRLGLGTNAPLVRMVVSDPGALPGPYASTVDKLAVIGADNTTVTITTPADKTGGYYFSRPDHRDPGGIIYRHSINVMDFRVNAATRMRVDADGNLGIGTTLPQQKLDVAGVIRAGNAPATAGSTMLVDAYTNGNLATLGTEHSSGGLVLGFGVVPMSGTSAAFTSSTPTPLARSAITLAASIRFYTGASQTLPTGTPAVAEEVMRLTNTGLLGIGTNAPVARLHIKDGWFRQESAGGFVELGRNAADFSLYDNVRCRSDATDSLGYCDGLARAVVHLSGDVLNLNYTNDFDGGTLIGATATGTWFRPSGHVGIGGVSNPAYALDVAGAVRGTDFRIENGPGVGTYALIRPELPLATVATACPAGSRVITVAQRMMGRTGSQICAADTASDGARTSCAAVKYHYIRNNGQTGAHAGGDLGCGAVVNYPWPWGQIAGTNSRPDEWSGAATYAVCCQ